MRALREVGVGTRRSGGCCGACGVRLAMFWRAGLLLPLGCCACTFDGARCVWDRTLTGRKWDFFLLDVGEVFWVVFWR